MKKKKGLIIGGSILAVIILLLVIVFAVMHATVNKVSKGTIADHVFIDNVDVSGLIATEAEEVLLEQLEKYQKEKVKLVAEETEIELTLGELGFEIKDLEKVVKEAVAYGKKGAIWSRYRQMKDLEKGTKNFDVSYTIDGTVAKMTISEKMPELENAAKNATIKRENGAFVVTEGVRGKKIDLKESVKIIENHFNKNWKHQGTETIKLETTVDEPDISKADLLKIKDMMGTYSTSFTRNNNRGKNVANAASRINGTVLMPGEEYSASTGMGERNAANGYFEAGSYENGETVQTYGGGVCQVSSTLYNAVILAELEITERWSHSMTVDYVKASMDAAVAEGYKDLKFKNNTDAPIYIEGYTVGGKLTFTIYGQDTRAEGRTISYVSEIISKSEVKKKFVTSNDAVGTIKQSASGHAAIKAKLWKVVKENGVEVSRTNVNNSSYQASTATWKVGIGTDNQEAKNIITSAVATQDEATIRAAVAQAQAIIASAQQPSGGSGGSGDSGLESGGNAQ